TRDENSTTRLHVVHAAVCFKLASLVRFHFHSNRTRDTISILWHMPNIDGIALFICAGLLFFKQKKLYILLVVMNCLYLMTEAICFASLPYVSFEILNRSCRDVDDILFIITLLRILHNLFINERIMLYIINDILTTNGYILFYLDVSGFGLAHVVSFPHASHFNNT
ncbi:hypothetical protein ACJX0J_030357, partial [Zea mays]